MTLTVDVSHVSIYTAAPRGIPRGGIVLVPGLRGRSRRLARQLAHAGYLVHAPAVLSGLGLGAREAKAVADLLNGEDVDPSATTDTVREAMSALRSPAFNRQVIGALRRTIDQVCESADVDRVAVIGAGAGGSFAYTLAAQDPRVRLVLSYDSTPPDIEMLEDITGAAASFYGGSHPAVNGSLPEIRAAMRRAGVPFASKAYPGLDHARLDRRQPADQVRDLWQRSLALLSLHLVRPPGRTG